METFYGSNFQGVVPLFSGQLNGKGGTDPIDINAIATAEKPFWLHFDYKAEQNERWVKNNPFFSDVVKEGLAGDVIRPRIVRTGEGSLITLQTINSNDNERPEQLIALRIFINQRIIISSRHRKIHALDEIKQDLAEGVGIENTGQFLVEMTDSITDEFADFIEDLHDKLIDIEETILEQHIPGRGELAQLRKQLIILRRYLAPQRDVFERLSSERIMWLTDEDRRLLQDTADRVARIIDDIDGCIARTSVISDEITNMMADAMNRRTYAMSLLAMVFLPTTFLTGLFGVNLGGIPGNEFRFGFSVFCVILAAIVGFVAWWLRKSKWL